MDGLAVEDQAQEETPHHAPQVVEAFDQAQRQTIKLFRDVTDQIQQGMSEVDIAQLAESRAPAFGFSDWFKKPSVQCGAKPKKRKQNMSNRHARSGSLIQITMSPATADAFGNFGGAFIFGTNESSKLVDEARNICKAACGFASRWKCTGEIYVFADAWASNRRFSLGDAKSIGHICFPPEGIFATGWPKSARLSTFAKRNQVEWFNHRRMRGVYAIQPPVLIQGESCAFQETILVDGPNKMILGRDDVEEVGTW